MLDEEVVFGAEVQVLAPGTIDAGLFEADLSAAALLAELEQVSAQLGDFLTTEPALDITSWSDDATGMMRAENGMYNTTVRGGGVAAGGVVGRKAAAQGLWLRACMHACLRPFFPVRRAACT
jgi:hypothetical protein